MGTIEKELNDCKAELNITDYALTLACEHIAKEHNLLFSIFGSTLSSVIKGYFICNARTILGVMNFTIDKKVREK